MKPSSLLDVLMFVPKTLCILCYLKLPFPNCLPNLKWRVLWSLVNCIRKNYVRTLKGILFMYLLTSNSKKNVCNGKLPVVNYLSAFGKY